MMKFLLFVVIVTVAMPITACGTIDSLTGNCYIYIDGEEYKLAVVTDAEGNNYKPQKLDIGGFYDICGIDRDAVPYNFGRRLQNAPEFYFKIPPDALEFRSSLTGDEGTLLDTIYVAGSGGPGKFQYDDEPLWPLSSTSRWR